ncbi:MAG: ATP-NAD kinase family protein [Hyphomicrobiaceae bacterium]
MARGRTDRTSVPLLVGLIVNPIAGMGGSVGLKGTDGADILHQAIALGAQPLSTSRAARALNALQPVADRICLLVPPRAMGGDALDGLNFASQFVSSRISGVSNAVDTRDAAMAMKDAGASLILFAGGDGTARDVVAAIGDSVALIGIPCGVKMYSGVFATSPEAAGHLAREFSDGHRDTDMAEVMDIDEAAYRAGQLTAQLFGYALVPSAGNRLQGPKSRSPLTHFGAVKSAAAAIVRSMQPGHIYLIGPGTSAKAVLDVLNLDGTLLGVDAMLDKRVVGLDLSASDVREITGSQRVHLILGVIGGQGYILGRGNQQIPPDAVKKAGRDGLLVLSTEEKLAQLAGGRLLVDTGDLELDKQLEGFIRVHTGPKRRMMMQLSAGH